MMDHLTGCSYSQEFLPSCDSLLVKFPYLLPVRGRTAPVHL
jgi:hypothetical protein